MGKFERALFCYVRVIVLNPNFWECWWSKGLALCSLEQSASAMNCFYRALEINPQYEDHWGDKLQLQQYEDAIAFFDQALAIEPSSETWRHKSICLKELKRYEEALNCDEKAIECDCHNQQAWLSKAIDLSKLGRQEEAIASYRQALTIDPDYTDATYGIACCYGLLGNTELACNYLAIVILADRPRYCQMANDDPDFDPIRQTDCFVNLLK